MLTKAGKGNVMVALDKTVYINKINQMLQNTHTYSKVKNPINKMVIVLRGFRVVSMS